MAEINRGEVCQGFIFGQNMEDRVVQAADGEEEEEKGESDLTLPEDIGARLEGGNPLLASAGDSETVSSTSTPLLRPSSFSANNSNNSAPSTTAAAATAGVISAGTLSSNPFSAARSNAHCVSSSSESEKPIVAPSHFSNTSCDAAPHIVVSADNDTTTAATTAQCNRFVLRPSALDRQTVNFGRSLAHDTCSSHRSTFKLEPARLQSPLVSSRLTAGGETDSKTTTTSPDNGVRADSTRSASPRSDTCRRQRLFGDGPPTTAPLGPPTFTSTEDEPRTMTTSSVGAAAASADVRDSVSSSGNRMRSCSSVSDNRTSTGFVFGESMYQRVTNAVVSSSNGGDVSPVSMNVPLDSTDDNTMSSVDGNGEVSVAAQQTLHESAAAEQAKRRKMELEEVEVRTGEEDECNVFQLNAKLHMFQKEQHTWVEKGRGLLRLNDMSDSETAAFQSRLVMRTQGSLRVVLNTKIWPGMSVERASPKSVRLTAVGDGPGVKIFLITGSPNDTDQIFKAIDRRVQQLKEQRREETGADTSLSAASVCDGQLSIPPPTLTEKRLADEVDSGDTAVTVTPTKKARVDVESAGKDVREESNDSSTLDPETEASSESVTSSPPMKSSSSDA